MDRNRPYYKQVQLLLRVLPFVTEEACFALKGGTAINLFVRDFPRLSVDIDLVYLPDNDRDAALADIRDALERIADAIAAALHGARAFRSYQDKADALRLLVSSGGVVIKIELSPVLRGTVYTPEERGVVAAVEDEFGFAEARIVAIEDLYAGKLCAALDRQHPRPMEELLAPNWKQQESLFEGEFRGMAFREVTLEEMRLTMEKVLVQVVSTMIPGEKRFLCSLYEGDPQWRLLGLDGVMSLPTVKWKLQNIMKMDSAKRAASLERLRQILGLAE